MIVHFSPVGQPGWRFRQLPLRAGLTAVSAGNTLVTGLYATVVAVALGYLLCRAEAQVADLKRRYFGIFHDRIDR